MRHELARLEVRLACGGSLTSRPANPLVLGMQVVGREKYGVLPLKGKILNVRVASAAQVLCRPPAWKQGPPPISRHTNTPHPHPHIGVHSIRYCVPPPGRGGCRPHPGASSHRPLSALSLPRLSLTVSQPPHSPSRRSLSLSLPAATWWQLTSAVLEACVVQCLQGHDARNAAQVRLWPAW